MKKNNKSTLRRIIATLGLVLMLSLSLTGLTQPARALPSIVNAAASIGLSSNDLYFNHFSTSTTVTVSGVSSYTATPRASWIHTSISGNKLTIYVDYLDSTSTRTSSISITSGSLFRTISVTQYPRVEVFEDSSRTRLVNTITVRGVQTKINPVSTTVYVRSTGKTLTATPNNPWLRTEVSGNKVTIFANPNTSLSERRGSVTLSNGYETKQVTIIQQKIVPDKITTYPYMGPTVFSLTNSLKNAYKKIEFDSNWSKKSIADQGALIKTLGEEIRKYLGLSDSQKVTVYYTSDFSFDKDEFGYTKYDDETGKPLAIYLNPAKCKTDAETLVTTLFHEYRHVWQARISKYDGTMFQYLVEYNRRAGVYIQYDPDHPDNYKNQFIEKDAETYAQKLRSALYNACK